jgi:hypothetical protein
VAWLAPLSFLLLSVAPGFSVAAQAGAAAPEDQIAVGRRIYREGLLPDGQPLRGVGQAGATLTGSDVACTTCHRRSGYGSSEGPIEVRSITGPALFGARVAPVVPGSPVTGAPVAVKDPQGTVSGQSAAEIARARAQVLREARSAMFAGVRTRPTYDDATLARAIRAGVDVTGKVMDPAMPRFALDAPAMAALTAYLKTLSIAVSPGVTEDTVHFATVIQPGTDPAQRRALIDVLQTFVRDRNLGQRNEQRRESGGQVHLGRNFRSWELHVWELKGPGDSWDAQLEAYYRQQPVFALVSGLGASSWRPIQAFSERNELPCLFPQTALPALGEPNTYTVYLSQGVTLEAQSLAKYLHDAGERGPVVQLSGADPQSAAAAAAFRDAWAAAGGTLQDRSVGAPPGAAYWQQLARETPGATLVLWLTPQSLAEAGALTGPASTVKAVYLSSALGGERHSAFAPDAAGRLRLVYPQDPPAIRDARLAVVKRWMQNNALAVTDETVQFNAYLAATVLGMLVSHGMDTFSRDFVLERMEHRLGTALELSIYPHLSLGPGQRYASKGSYIVQIAPDGKLAPLSDWIVP